TQCRPGSEQTDHNGVWSEAEQVRRLFCIDLLDVPEEEHGAVGFWQVVNAPSNERARLLTLQEHITRGLPACDPAGPLALRIEAGEQLLDRSEERRVGKEGELRGWLE